MNDKRCTQKTHLNQQGAGFVELLVALVILAIGLLGVLSLQARGLNSNQRAVFTTDVTLLAYDMSDRILAYGSGGDGASDGTYGGIDITQNTDKTNCNDEAGCTIVQQDVNDWIDAFSDSKLPSGQGAVVWSAGTSVYTITIHWDQERIGNLPRKAEGVNCVDVNPEVALSCFDLQVSL